MCKRLRDIRVSMCEPLNGGRKKTVLKYWGEVIRCSFAERLTWIALWIQNQQHLFGMLTSSGPAMPLINIDYAHNDLFYQLLKYKYWICAKTVPKVIKIFSTGGDSVRVLWHNANSSCAIFSYFIKYTLNCGTLLWVLAGSQSLACDSCHPDANNPHVLRVCFTCSHLGAHAWLAE